MKRYKLSTGLWEATEKPLFQNDKEAWEHMRILLPNKFARLYREETIDVAIVNKRGYVASYNKKYTKQIRQNETNKATYWLPVLDGITSDPYGGME